MSDFDGASYDPLLDRERLTTQMQRVRSAMSDGQWHTILDIATIGEIPMESWPGLTARIRDQRKIRFGGATVDRRRVSDGRRGIFEYRLTAAGVESREGA